MQLTINGEVRDLADNATVAEVLGDRRRGVAVAVNREVVPRSAWSSAALHDGDHIEIVEVRQGG